MDILVLIPCGRDRFDRPVFRDGEGNAYVDLDYQKHPRTCIATKWPRKNFYYGEPDYKIIGREDGKDLFKVIFAQE